MTVASIADPAACAPPVGLGQRIVQIHPTLACNLRCTHCYSSSGPAMRGAIDLGRLRDAVDDCAALGYATIAVSGGEPLAYPALAELLAHARGRGLRTLVTTNGTLLDAARMQQLQGLVDVLAISVDGPPEIHNEIRASSNAFERTLRGIDVAASSGQRFGIIHALTPRTWEHLPWLGEFAVEHGASLLQIHPLEQTGRAAAEMAGDVIDDDLLAKVWLIVTAMRATYDSLDIQLDVFDREEIEPRMLYATPDAPRDDERAADLLGLLIIEADGSVVPISYGMSHEYAVCNINERRIADAWPAYRTSGYRAFRELCADVWQELPACGLPFFNWHELVVERSVRTRSRS